MNMKHRRKRLTAMAAGFLIAAAAIPSVSIPASAATLLSAEFETTDDSFKGRGGATVGWLADEAYKVNCSLFVSGREKEWAGAERDASTLLKDGETYSMSVAVLQKSGEDVEMKFSLEYQNASGETDWDKIDLKTVPSDEWTVLSNDAYQIPAGGTPLKIYVETTKSLTDFYMDSVTVKGSPAKIKQGDANGDLSVDEKDVTALAEFLVGKSDEIEKGADMNEDNVINAVDLTLLKTAIMFPPEKPPTEIIGDWDNYQEQATGNDLKALQGSLRRIGNTSRIRDKIAQAQKGEKVTIGYIGGSITEGGSSTSADKSFVNISGNYFKNTFGTGNNVSFINKGLAGTSSVVGNMRVDEDLLSQHCDIIFIEFAVNDQGDDRFRKSYESLVKKCLTQENEPAVILITLCQKSLSTNEDWMAQVGEHYDLPVISGKGAIQAGSVNWDSQYGSGDTIHPGNGGHQMIADWIGYYYRQALRSENASDPYELPATEKFGADYANAHLVPFNQLQNFDAGGWNNSNGSYTTKGSGTMKFTINGKGILLMFQSNSNGSIGAVNVTANGKTNKVDGNLQWTWGGKDGNVGYYQPNSDKIDISIAAAGGNFTIYGIAVIE